jgi:hypothetical protein
MVVLAFLQALTAQQQQELVAVAVALTMRLVALLAVQAALAVVVMVQTTYFRRVEMVIQILVAAEAVELHQQALVLQEVMEDQAL